MPLPEPVAIAAQHHQLGDLESVHESHATGWDIWNLSVATALPIIGAVFFASVMEDADPLAVLVISVALVYAALRVAYLATRSRHRAYLFERGCVVTHGQKVLAFHAATTTIRQARVHHYYGFADRGTSHDTGLAGTDGTADLTERYEGIKEFSEAMELKIAEHQGPQVLAHLQTGGSTSFGPFTITPEGIKRWHSTLTWPEYAGFEIDNGELLLYRTGKKNKLHTWDRMTASKISNFNTFLVLIETLREAGLSEPAEDQ